MFLFVTQRPHHEFFQQHIMKNNKISSFEKIYFVLKGEILSL